MSYTPTKIETSDAHTLTITWSDGHVSRYPFFDLRVNCRCAECIHEMTGEKILKSESVSPNITPTHMEYVGRYALAIHWSDGHKTGIYTFEHLRKMCPCCRPGDAGSSPA